MPPKKEECLCGQCGKVVKEGIQCDICDVWWHPVCAGINSDLCESLGTNEQLHWYCIRCNSGAGKLLKEVLKMQDRMASVEDKIKKVDEMMDKLKEGMCKDVDKVLTNIKKDLDERPTEKVIKQLIADEMNKIKNEFFALKDLQPCAEIRQQVEDLTTAFVNDGKWTDVVKRQVEIRINDVSEEIQDIHKMVVETKQKADTEIDREQRRKNIIIYRVPESSATSYEGRMNDDKKLVGKIMDCVYGENYENYESQHITKVIRLGRRKDTGDRPLLVQFENGMDKNYLMNNLRRLKNGDEILKKLIISHDMTMSEREDCRKQVEEAKLKAAEDQSGEYIYRVRGLPGAMRVVRWRKY